LRSLSRTGVSLPSGWSPSAFLTFWESSSLVNGLRMYPVTTSCSPKMSAPISVVAVSIIIFMPSVSPFSFKVRRTAQPSMSGMFMSRSIRSGLSDWTLARHSRPPMAVRG